MSVLMQVPTYSSEIAIPEFLSGGGEMGQRIREFDWSATPLGPFQTWPQSLRTCIRIMLTSRQPIWIGWGKDLIKFYNDPYKAIVGGKHPWALGKPASVVWKDIWRDIEPLLKTVMENDEGTYVESQLLIMERNGYPEETYYTFSYTPISGDEGGTAGMICANTDDTDRIISDRQLRTLTQLGKRLTDATSNIEVFNKTIATIKENPQDFPFALLYSLNGDVATLSLSTDVGASADHITRELDLNSSNELSQLLAQAAFQRKFQLLEGLSSRLGAMPSGAWEIAPEKAIILPVALSTQKEPYAFLLVGLNPYRMLDEKYIGFFNLIADQIATSLSNVNTIDEERKRSEALAEIDKAKTIFFSNISHEFRTPLTLLLGPIEDALNDASTTAANKTRLDVAHRNAIRMQKLVNTLLEFSRIEAGRMHGNFHQLDICSFTEDLASTFRSAIEKAGMQLEYRCKKVREDVYVDPDMWEKIVLNLISNAFKYTNEGSITVAVEELEGQLQLSVTDTGVGIPEKELDKIFDRFHRIENIGGRSQEGTGIGLALVRELVKLHHGSIEVKSTVAKGSTFLVKIPLGKDHLPKDKIVKKASATMQSSNSAAFVQEALKWIPRNNGKEWKPAQMVEGDQAIEPGSTLRAKIILADDNADMREYVERLLADQYTVITATNGEDAFELAVKYKPDLILSDIMMPRLDGFGLLKKIRTQAETKNIPVIFLSAKAGEEAKIEGLDAGADDYLVKPFSAKELIVRVSNHIRINQVRRETEKQFYQLFMQAPAIIHVLKGPDHVFELFHPFGRKVSSGKDLTGFKIRDVAPELEGQGLFEILDEVYRTGNTVTQKEVHYALKNHQDEIKDYYFNMSVQAWRDVHARIQGVMIFAVEITESILARKKIEQNEERFRLLATSIPQIVWTTDPIGKIEYLSEQWTTFTGLSTDPQKHSWMDILHPDDAADALAEWEKSLATGTVWQAEYRLKNPSTGIWRWFLGVARPLKDEKGKVVKWVGAATDIEVFKEQSRVLEEQVRERTQELNKINFSLQQSNEDLQQFAHVASHDLKEPLRKIKIFGGRLHEEFEPLLPEKGKVYLDKIHASADRMFSMIEGVLKYSTFNSFEQPTQPVDLNSILKSIEADLELMIQQRNAQIRSDQLPTIEGSAVLLYQLFYNLINNSLKFSKEDVQPHINITAAIAMENGQQYAKITLEDNGIGFDQDYAELIFNTFTRLNPKDRFEGTGLGLSLCRKIVQRHGGSISAMGRMDGGAVFTLILPVHSNGRFV